MNRKGFTLFEVLAALVILAVLTLITVPAITGIVDNVNKSAAEKTLSSFIKIIDLRQTEYMTDYETSARYEDLDISSKDRNNIEKETVFFMGNGEILYVKALVNNEYVCTYNYKETICNNRDDMEDGIANIISIQSFQNILNAIQKQFNLPDNYALYFFYNTFNYYGTYNDNAEEYEKFLEDEINWSNNDKLIQFATSKNAGMLYKYLMGFYSPSLNRSLISSITFSNDGTTVDNADIVLDISNKMDDSIILYAKKNGTVLDYENAYICSASEIDDFEMYDVTISTTNDYITLNDNARGFFEYFINVNSITNIDDLDVSKSKDLSSMFNRTGFESETFTLDLGTNFDISSATNMNQMFSYTGNNSMTSLNLGPGFINIPTKNSDMFEQTGKSGCVIYVPSSIYSSSTQLYSNGEYISYTTGTFAKQS